jgi:iron complex transport system substrate-binding protein
MNRYALLLLFCLLFMGCNLKHPADRFFHGFNNPHTEPVLYARGFALQTDGYNVLVTIRNPWQNARNVEYFYFLSDTADKSRILDENHSIIKTPVRKVVCLSTTHIGFISFLHETNSVIGISGRNLVANEELQAMILTNDLPDVGYDENLNFELILNLKPDVVLAYGVSGTVTNTVRKLNELGIPAILIAEYLEEEPLAKMEWIKVFGALFNLESIATLKFDSVAIKYKQLSALTANLTSKPSVLLGLPWRGTWYVSGGESYVAKLISDAGGKYIFSDYTFKDSRPVALEKIFERALGADFWLNSGDAGSLADIFRVDERFINLTSVKQNRVYNNNNKIMPPGGNAFFESGVVEPEIILSDLIYILHPQLLPSHQLKYYKKLQ